MNSGPRAPPLLPATESRLSDIRIYKPRANPRDLPEDEFVYLCRQFDREVKQILQNHHLSLRAVEIVGAYALWKLSHPPL